MAKSSLTVRQVMGRAPLSARPIDSTIRSSGCSGSMEAAMVGSVRPPEAGELDALASKFRSLELGSEADLQMVLRLVKARKAVGSGENIVDTRSPPKQLTVLLAGVACLHKRLEDDSRQIYTFQYPGDFCDLPRYMLPELD